MQPPFCPCCDFNLTFLHACTQRSSADQRLFSRSHDRIDLTRISPTTSWEQHQFRSFNEHPTYTASFVGFQHSTPRRFTVQKLTNTLVFAMIGCWANYRRINLTHKIKSMMSLLFWFKLQPLFARTTGTYWTIIIAYGCSWYQYKYICTDCRRYTKIEANQRHPLHLGYMQLFGDVSKLETPNSRPCVTMVPSGCNS